MVKNVIKLSHFEFRCLMLRDEFRKNDFIWGFDLKPHKFAVCLKDNFMPRSRPMAENWRLPL